MKGERMNLQAVEKGCQSLDLRTGEIPVGKMFATDEQTAIGTGDGDGPICFMYCQCLKGFEEKIVAALDLGIGTRVQPHCPESCEQSDGEINEQVVPLRG